MDPPPPGADAAQAGELAVIAPLTSHDRLIGLLALGRRVGGGDFARMDLEVLRASLNVLGVALDNARLRDRLAECRRRLRLAGDALRQRDDSVRLSRGDAKSLLTAVHEDRRPGFAAELRALEVSVAAGVPPALFDRERAARILDAMLDDALRRAPCGARVRLRLEQATDGEGSWVAAEVRDEGPGLAPDELARLLDAPDAGDGRAGLATARLWAERMGARLDAASEAGHGTVLTLRMPAA
jgi:signal transduction histidine kinase